MRILNANEKPTRSTPVVGIMEPDAHDECTREALPHCTVPTWSTDLPETDVWRRRRGFAVDRILSDGGRRPQSIAKCKNPFCVWRRHFRSSSNFVLSHGCLKVESCLLRRKPGVVALGGPSSLAHFGSFAHLEDSFIRVCTASAT